MFWQRVLGLPFALLGVPDDVLHKRVGSRVSGVRHVAIDPIGDFATLDHRASPHQLAEQLAREHQQQRWSLPLGFAEQNVPIFPDDALISATPRLQSQQAIHKRLVHVGYVQHAVRPDGVLGRWCAADSFWHKLGE